jgi:hypothetical protein
MCKWLYLAPMLAAAAWGQIRPNPVNVIPITPVGGLVVPSGTLLKVRVNESLSTNKNVRDDRFDGTLTDPVIVNGQTVVPVGTRLTGHVLENHPAGIVKGRAQLMLALDAIEYRGHTFTLTLTTATCAVERKPKGDEVGGPNAGVAVGDREEATIPAEAVVTFTMGAPVRI